MEAAAATLQHAWRGFRLRRARSGTRDGRATLRPRVTPYHQTATSRSMPPRGRARCCRAAVARRCRAAAAAPWADLQRSVVCTCTKE
eukprot:1316112-Prymnesium_polylepis.1